MRVAIIAGGIALAATLAIAPAAQAFIVDVTFAGSVRNARGGLGAFGTEDINLNGLRYVAKYRYDTGLGTYTIGGTASFPFENVIGGTNSGGLGLSPLLKATLTINGVTVDFGGDTYAFLGPIRYLSYAGLRTVARYKEDTQFGDRQTLDHEVLWDARLFNISKSLNQSFTYSVRPEDSITAFFEMQDTTASPCCFSRGASGQLRPDTIIYQVAVVPEPGVWALMVAGFGLAGGSLRWRRASATRARLGVRRDRRK